VKHSLKPLSSATVTVLVENMASRVLGEWGVSFFLDTGQHQVLFDTGRGQLLLQNAQALGIDLATTDSIVISHGHLDHTGGLVDALHVSASVDLFVHPAAFEARYWKRDTAAIRYSFPLTRQQVREEVGKLVETERPTRVCDGVMVTGQIARTNVFEDTGIREYAFLDESLQTPDPMLDDQALFFRVSEGVVILLGCGHAGVVNTMQYVSELLGEEKIYAIMGGSHLVSASPDRMQKTIEALKKFDVQKLMLTHCTGVDAYARLYNVFPDRCTWPAAGSKIRFGKE
jgi:7,8-dihydropterin-6-yl-methyl-4-(beta-D-ribofuranosyl)aminobenzene 5'-phosphate synthase